MVNYITEKKAFGELEVMEVANLRDSHPAETIWNAGKVDGILFDTQVVARDFA